MHIRVGLVILNQVSGKAGCHLRRSVFPRVDGRCDEQLGFVPGDRFVGQAQDVHIVAVRLPDALLPGIPDVRPFCQGWVYRCQRGAVSVEFLHRAVAVIRRRQGVQSLAREQVQLAVVGGLLFIQGGGEAHALDGGDFGSSRRYEHVFIFLVVKLK